MSIWNACNIEPYGDWYYKLGASMGDTFRVANKNAYVMLDRGTWLANRGDSRLVVHVEKDTLLENPYQKQLLSWSSLLLRVQDPEQYHNYLKNFYEQERNTRLHIKNLENLLGECIEDGSEIKEFNSSHDMLGLRYRKALKIFNQLDNPVYETDRFIWGAVDNPSRLLSELKLNLIDRQKQQVAKAEKSMSIIRL